MRNETRLAKYFKRIILAVFPIIIMIIIAESTAKVFFPKWAPRTGRIVNLWQYDQDYGWSHVPNSKGRFDSHGFNTAVDINSQGFRGPEYETERELGKLRIAVIGDSFVWGFGVEHDEVFTSIMQKKCPELDILNFGVSGYSTDQELLLYNDISDQYMPDIVILVVAGNDFESNGRSKEYVYYHKPMFRLKNGHLELTNVPVPRSNFLIRGSAKLARRSYLLTQMNRVIRGFRQKNELREAESNYSSVTHDPKSIEFPSTNAELVTLELMREYISTVNNNDTRMVIVFVDGQDGRDRRLREALNDTNTTFIHLDDYFMESDHEGHHLIGDFHWNPEGHKLVANMVINELFNQSIIRCASSAQ